MSFSSYISCAALLRDMFTIIMCLFPLRNTNIKTPQYKKGLHEFDCGACPECLAKRSRLWALRCSMQARIDKACMITLTYDQFIRDEKGKIVGETLAEHALDKTDVQKFLKRLRSHYDEKVNTKIRRLIRDKIKAAFSVTKYRHLFTRFIDYKRFIFSTYKADISSYKKTLFEKYKVNIKYLATAERGKRTNRPHYHVILFGTDFAEDRIPYKKSKRGNLIYMSDTLTSIWGHGICTVDCVNISSKVARYCTKYCAKDSRAPETFMLMSRGIGDSELLREFNGLYYVVDGRKYPVPKLIWNKVICKRYSSLRYYRYIYGEKVRIRPDYKYKQYSFDHIEEFLKNCYERRFFKRLRDSDKQYQRYLKYWQEYSKVIELTRGNAFTRMLALPNEKYYSYKQACLRCYEKRHQRVEPIAPRANAKARYEHEFFKEYGLSFNEDGSLWLHREKNICPDPSRHIRADDREFTKKDKFPKTKIINSVDGTKKVVHFYPRPNLISPF